MKKKIFSIFLVMFMILSTSISSFANPLILSKVAEVSVIYSIGRLAMDTIGFVGDIGDVMDLGSSIFGKMTSSQKENYKNSIKFEDDKFTYSDDSYSYISSYVPPSNGQHLMEGIRKTVYPSTRFFDSGDKYYETSDIKLIFDDYKFSVNVQGYELEFLVQRRDYTTTDYRYYIFYKMAGDSIDNLVRLDTRSIKKSDVLWFELYYTDVKSGKGSLYLDVYYGNLNSSTYYTKKLINGSIPNSCEFCPHHVSLSPSYKYPTSSELEEIEKNYPQYENDIKIPGDHLSDDEGSTGGGSDDEGSTGGGSDDEGSTGGGSDDEVQIKPIGPPPSFPSLEGLDFNAFDFSPLMDFFSNFKSKFPFSIPFDIYNIVSFFVAEPQTPDFDIELLGATIPFRISMFEDLVNITKTFVVIGWTFTLFNFTRKIGG